MGGDTHHPDHLPERQVVAAAVAAAGADPSVGLVRIVEQQATGGLEGQKPGKDDAHDGES